LGVRNKAKKEGEKKKRKNNKSRVSRGVEEIPYILSKITIKSHT
jgi:hypothetical protein